MSWSSKKSAKHSADEHAGRPAIATEAITAFWRWWSESGRTLISHALEARTPEVFVADLSRRVGEIDSRLDWETGAGVASRHVLTLSGVGDPALRRVAERWVRASPPADDEWAFSPARVATPPGQIGARLTIHDTDLDIAALTFTISREGRASRIDVVLHLAELGELPSDQARTQASFLLLDAVLGEDAVERWVGEFTWSSANEGAETAAGLRQAVADLVAERPAEATWTVAMGTRPDGRRVIARTQPWLRWLDRPLYDLHTRITFTSTTSGQPGDPADEVEDQLVAAIDGRAELVTVRTSPGELAFDVYSDSEDQNVTQFLRDWAKRHGGDSAQIPDPTWKRSRLR